MYVYVRVDAYARTKSKVGFLSLLAQDDERCVYVNESYNKCIQYIRIITSPPSSPNKNMIYMHMHTIYIVAFPP